MTVSGEELEAHLERERSMADRVPNKTALKDITYGSVRSSCARRLQAELTCVGSSRSLAWSRKSSSILSTSSRSGYSHSRMIDRYDIEDRSTASLRRSGTRASEDSTESVS